MEPLPLVPRNKDPTNHDTSHIIRESFQELLAEPRFSKILAENVQKYNVNTESLKICGVTANTAYRTAETIFDNIDKVGEEFLMRKAEYLIAKDIIRDDEAVREMIKLRRQEIFRKMSKQSVAQYGLLDCKNLLPSVPERSIDFRLNSNRHLCRPPCRLKSDDVKVSKKLPSIVDKGSIEQDDTEDVSVLFFQALPDHVIFYNYQMNVTYKKKLKLKNISSNVRHVRLKEPPRSRFFTVHLESPAKVAAGMHAEYLVTFKTNIYRDARDSVTFVTCSGQEVTVRLVSQRESPTLRAYLFRYNHVTTKSFSSRSFCNVDRTIALNSTIDCGFGLLGKELHLSLIVKNEGPHGRFFIMTEENWFSLDVQNINVDMELCADVFHIYPAYFEVSHNEFVNLSVTFYPKKYGLYVQTVYMLCSNNMFEQLDLTGDGLNFDSSYITFELKKKSGRPFFLDSEADYCLHIGHCLCCTKCSGLIRVNNNSALNFSFQWNIRKCESPNGFDFKHMLPHWITVKPFACLPPYSTTDFEVTAFPETREGGLYRIVLSLIMGTKNTSVDWLESVISPGNMHVRPLCVADINLTYYRLIYRHNSTIIIYVSMLIKNIPEVSLQDHHEFTVLERSDYADTRMLDILVGEIEVLCEVEEVKVVIEPNPLDIPFILPDQSSHKQAFCVVNSTNFDLQCKWLPRKDNCKVSIRPNEFLLQGKSHQCMVHVFPTDFEDIEEDFILDVNEGAFKEYFLVTVKVKAPSLAFSSVALNFGNLMMDCSYRSPVEIQNNSGQTLSWYVVEDVHNTTTKEVLTIKTPPALKLCNGVLEQEKCTLEYMPNTQKCGDWLSYLKLHTNFSESEQPDSTCAIHYKVCKSEVLVHTNTSELPILCPQEILYVGVSTDHHICLHNCGEIDTVFVLGKPTGKAADDFDITLAPRFGNVRVRENIYIDIRITPLRMGYYEDIFVPCFVLGVERVFLIKIMCVVGDVMVNVYVPNDLGNYNIVLWPELKISESCYCEDASAEHNSNDKSAQDLTSEDEIEEFLEKHFKQAIEENPKTEDEQESESPDRGGTFFTDEYGFTTIYDSDNNKPVKLISSGKPLTASHSRIDLHSNLTEGTALSVVTVASKSTSTSDVSTDRFPSKEKMKELFGPGLVLHDCVLVFASVSLNTPVKKTIKVENLTPGYGAVYSEVTNFFHTEPEEDTVRDAMVKLNLGKLNEWEEIISSDGIVIKTEPPGKNLNPYETIEVDVWVYANTWGYYVDELVLDISELSPFCISLVIEVVGVPIEFPISLNTICNEPTLRLGMLPLRSEKIYRKIKVANTSMAPVYVTWHYFIKGEESKPFNIIFDITDPIQEDLINLSVKGEAVLTNEYFGIPAPLYFQVQPEILLIQPRSHAFLQLQVNVCCFSEQYLHKKIEGRLIGSVHLTTEYKFQPNLFTRPTGVHIGAASLRISGKLDVAQICIDNFPENIEMSAYATDIVDGRQFVQTKRLMFRNPKLTPAVICMTIEEPFRFLSIKTLRTTASEFENSVVLQANECLEVVVECELDAAEVRKFVPTIKLSNATRTIAKHLTVYQRGVIQQKIPFTLVIFYPAFQVSPTHILFGNVFIGNTQKTLVSLKNFTAAPIPFQTIKSTRSNELVIRPETGIIPNATVGGDFVLSIFFTPEEPKAYKEMIFVISNIPRYEASINVIGVGSYNEAFYVAGKH